MKSDLPRSAVDDNSAHWKHRDHIPLIILRMHWQHRQRVKRDVTCCVVRKRYIEKKKRKNKRKIKMKKKRENYRRSRESRMREARANLRQIARTQTIYRDIPSISPPSLCPDLAWETAGYSFLPRSAHQPRHYTRSGKDARVTPGAREAQPLSAGGCRAVSALGRGC